MVLSRLLLCELFVGFLEVVLALGNYINGGTFRANAYGFKIGGLAKLNDTKGVDNKTTLLHFIVTYLQSPKLKEQEKLIDFGQELLAIEPAHRISVSTLQQEMGELKKGMTNLQKELQNPLYEKDERDKFKSKISEFEKWASRDVDGLVELYDKCQSNMKELASFYGEDPKTFNPEEFFGSMNSFLQMFEKAKQDVIAGAAAIDDKLPKEKGKIVQIRQREGRDDALKGKKETGLMDSAYSQLADGTAFAGRDKRRKNAAGPHDKPKMPSLAEIKSVGLRRTKK